MPAVGARPRGPEGPACPSCGTMNPAGMSFCKMCGTALQTGRPATGGPAPGRVACSQCGRQTPAGYAFCQHCGHRLQGVAVGPAGSDGAAGPAGRAGVVAKAMPLMPTPPAGLRPASGAPGFGAGPVGAAPTGLTGAAAAGPAGGPPVRGGGQLVGRLITVRRDGSDGDVIPLTGETFDIGRTEGNLCFAEDPFLAPRHARLLAYGGVVRIRVLDTVNGVFIRLREPHELQPGDVFYVGKELLRFEALSPEERDPPSLVEHGVRLFGSAPRESWGRLRQLTCAGTTRDMWYLSRPEVVLGREEGDITFPDDEFMSRRHAVLSRSGNRARLIDQNSSNGTYLRVRGDRELRPSDVLRMGDQLLRFEP
ncbi:MAG: FHA domain-containing protein [Myxococcales bacterium]|nr:FHA domain-containing protein [Myxococcales bacterium]